MADQGRAFRRTGYRTFEPLYSETRSGMGVGLAICLDIMDCMAGASGMSRIPAGEPFSGFTLRKSSAVN